MANEGNRTNTSTQIRNFYSANDSSYLNISFFNTNLSFRFSPFVSKDQMGKVTFDLKHYLNTTVNFEGASALSIVAKDIIDGKIQECNLPIPCAAGASLNLERRLNQNGIYETVFTITKNGQSVPFTFKTMTIQVKENGQMINKTIESGLDSFYKTIEGYLTGINSERHLNKLTDDYVKSINNGDNNQNNQNGNGGYNNNYRRNYNNNGNYRNNYRNNNYNNQQQPQQQNTSSYQLNG